MKTREQLETELKLLESGADAIREQLAAMPMQWEPEGGGYFIDPVGDVMGHGGTFEGYRNFGIERKTSEAAERAAIEMRKFNRLLAYRDEFAPGYDPDWANTKAGKYYVYFRSESRSYHFTHETKSYSLGVAYMPKNVVEELCRKLNSGEVVL